MTGFDVVAEARLEYDDEEISPEMAEENIRQMIQDGTISPEVTVEWHDED